MNRNAVAGVLCATSLAAGFGLGFQLSNSTRAESQATVTKALATIDKSQEAMNAWRDVAAKWEANTKSCLEGFQRANNALESVIRR